MPGMKLIWMWHNCRIVLKVSNGTTKQMIQ
jgi:hypothetical protein